MKSAADLRKKEMKRTTSKADQRAALQQLESDNERLAELETSQLEEWYRDAKARLDQANTQELDDLKNVQNSKKQLLLSGFPASTALPVAVSACAHGVQASICLRRLTSRPPTSPQTTCDTAARAVTHT